MPRSLRAGQVFRSTNGQNTLHFFYDAAGKPAMVEWNNGTTTAKYAYVQNLQGDIVGIIDSLGNEVVKYTYDAWGKPLSTTGPLAATLGKLNPFRYRGYVFDEETGLYYLRSRYYNPNWNRFVNADNILTTNNLFHYSNNSPIIFSDDDGNAPTSNNSLDISNCYSLSIKEIDLRILNIAQKVYSGLSAGDELPIFPDFLLDYLVKVKIDQIDNIRFHTTMFTANELENALYDVGNFLCDSSDYASISVASLISQYFRIPYNQNTEDLFNLLFKFCGMPSSFSYKPKVKHECKSYRLEITWTKTSQAKTTSVYIFRGCDHPDCDSFNGYQGFIYFYGFRPASFDYIRFSN